MRTAISGGAALLLAALLLTAGSLKLAQPRAFAHALYRLLPTRLPRRRALAVAGAPVVAGLEIAVGAALLAAPQFAVPVAAIGAALFLAFVGVVVAAIRKGTSCGCFTSFSDGTAGAAELVRTTALAVVASGLLALDVGGHSGSVWTLRAGAAAVVVAALVIAVTLIGARGTQRSVADLGWTVLGRVRSRLTAVELPKRAALKAAERARVLEAAAGTPSVRAFIAWLGERGDEVDLARSFVRSAAADVPGGRRVDCILLDPPPRPGLRITISVPWDGQRASDAVVIAAVDGLSIYVSGGEVRRPAPPPAKPVAGQRVQVGEAAVRGAR